MIPARHLLSGLVLFAVVASGCGLSPTAPKAAGRGQGFVGASAKAPLRAAPAGYYDGVAGQSGRALLSGLHNLVAKHKDLGYDGARDAMFSTVDDLDNDNEVTCIYIGRTLDNVTNRTTAFRNGAGLNAEHTWPQSKGAEGAAKADLHHLFPSDCKANSTRGSFPFGVVKSPDWEQGGSKRGSDAQGHTVFEPRVDQRGDTARAILYFYTVYGVTGAPSLENFKIEEPVLKAWHQADPPSAADVKRNDAVMAAQGNRNPFVDHPEFVSAVGDFLQAGARR